METINKKFIIKFKVTNKNIRLRFLKEQDKDSSYTFSHMAKFFGIFTAKGEPDRVLAYKWSSKKPEMQRMPTKHKLCPHCNKSVYHYVEKWINDGSIN